MFYELYRGEAAPDEHEAQPITRHFLDHRDDYVESWTVDRLHLVAAKGIEALAPGQPRRQTDGQQYPWSVVPGHRGGVPDQLKSDHESSQPVVRSS